MEFSDVARIFLSHHRRGGSERREKSVHCRSNSYLTLFSTESTMNQSSAKKKKSKESREGRPKNIYILRKKSHFFLVNVLRERKRFPSREERKKSQRKKSEWERIFVDRIIHEKLDGCFWKDVSKFLLVCRFVVEYRSESIRNLNLDRQREEKNIEKTFF